MAKNENELKSEIDRLKQDMLNKNAEMIAY